MNCLLTGRPDGTTLAVARAFRAADPAAPVTLLSDDTDGLLRALQQPGLDRCEALWADAALLATVDDALVHRRMLHGQPDLVVVVADEERVADSLLAVLVPRLAGTPLVVTGDAAAALAPRLSAQLAALLDDGTVPRHAVVPGQRPRQSARQPRTSSAARRRRPPLPAALRPLRPLTLRPRPKDDHDEIRAGRGPGLGTRDRCAAAGLRAPTFTAT